MPLDVLITLVKFLELKDIFRFILPLSKTTNEYIKKENYVLFKKLVEELNLHRRVKRADTPGRTDMLILTKSWISVWKQPAVKLTPYAY